MISKKDFLPDYRTMNEETKKDWLDSVTKWTDETFPQLLAAAESWEKTPVKDFDEGCRLASAFVNARRIISSIYQYDSKKAIQKINAFLSEVRKRSGLAQKSYRMAGDKTRYRAIVPEQGMPDENGDLKVKEYAEPEVDEKRPQHLNEYLHLLPNELRESMPGKMKEMYLALAEYRGRLEVLVEHPNATQEQRAEMARKSVAQEREIRAAWEEIDKYIQLAKQNGGVAVEYLSPTKAFMNMKRPGDFTREEIEAMENFEQKEMCKKNRISGNKKYINRSDVKFTESYKEQLKLRIQELIDWGENLPERTQEACKQAGIEMPGQEEGNDNAEEECVE